jgi:hypothetical protein
MNITYYYAEVCGRTEGGSYISNTYHAMTRNHSKNKKKEVAEEIFETDSDDDWI